MQVVDRSLRMLELVGTHPDGLLLTEAAQTLELPPPSAHRILKALVEQGFVRRDDASLRYFAGPALLRISAAAASVTTFGSIVEPHIRDLSERFDETVFAAQMRGARAVSVVARQSTRPLRVSVDVGRDLPLHASAAARSLLAHRDQGEARGLLAGHDFVRFTPDTPRDVNAVMAHLERIRERGYDICENELDNEVWAVAVPILPGGTGPAIASLTVASPRHRHSDEAEREEIVATVREAAIAVASQLPSASLLGDTGAVPAPSPAPAGIV